jgi:flagellar biosynthesis/type III secretory pathway protein FliH
MCKIMEDFLRECREESYAEGYAEGYEEGYAEGYEEGYAEGYEEGRIEEGRVKELLKNIATLTQKGMSLEDALNLLDVSEADRALLCAEHRTCGNG